MEARPQPQVGTVGTTSPEHDLFESVLASLDDACVVLDADWRVVYANNRALEIAHRSREDCLLRPFFEIHPEFTGGEIESELRRAVAEMRVARFDVPIAGGRRWLEIRAHPSAHGLALFSTDVTERKQVEQALLRSRQELADFFENATVGLHWMGPDGRILWVNRAELALSGYTHAEYVGQHVSRFYADAHAVEDMLARLFAGETLQNHHMQLCCKDGSKRDVLLDLSVRWENNKFMHTRCFTRDVSDSIRARETLEQTNRALSRSNEDLNQFAYAASHDLREPLRMVSIYGQLLARRHADRLDREAGDYLRHIVEGAGRTEQLLRDLLAYSQAGEEAAEPAAPIEAEKPLATALLNLQVAIESSAAVVTHGALPRLSVHEIHLVSIFQNLIGNAIKYRSSDPPLIHVDAERAGERWWISVHDNGIGIEPRYHEHVFRIFKRLHGAKYPGTGIGLSICGRIVERYAGAFTLESSLGRGSTFRFHLPA